jgi:hypothetical protein
MVVAAAATGAAKIDPTILLIGAGALLLLTKWGVENILPEVGAKVNIVPESKEFLSGLLYGAESDYFYAADQSGSPNPPTQTWWEMASDLGATDDWIDRGAGPIRVEFGTAVPTSPIIGVNPPSQAERWGGNIRDWFTEGKLLEAIDPFPF